MSGAANKAVFLSYASQDAEAARRICEALRAAGVEVWFDQSELVGGDSWEAKIRKQIKECALFVPVISANTEARTEDHFRHEWLLAVERSRRMAEEKPFVVPVVVDATNEATASVPEKFRDVQWTLLPGGEVSVAFCVWLKNLLDGPAAPARIVARGESGGLGNVGGMPWSRGRATSGLAETQKLRRLAAIVFTDVVGYSARMQIDEAVTLALVQSDFEQMRRLCAQHGGQTLKSTGDGLLLCFASVVDAVTCALAIQVGFARRGGGALQHRIGVHLGDVYHQAGDIAGDGVNLAARLQTAAQPGTICVSDAVFGAVRGKVAMESVALAPLVLKNIAQPLPAHLIAPVGTRLAAGAPKPRDKTIAVLAFANLSRDPENEYFSDGISEELLNVLAKIPGLRVTARTSAFFFKGRNVPVPEIAQKLGVAHVVEGSVRKVGSRVRITAQLVDAADGFHVWSDNFDRELKDIFAVQDEIARLIAQNLQLKLSEDSRSVAVVNPEAYRLCLEGRQHVMMISDESLARAEALFEGALSQDPNFGPASAGLAYVWHVRTRLNQVATRYVTDDLARSELHARRALAADAGLGEAHVMLGAVSFMRGELEPAGKLFDHGMALTPNYEAGLDIQGFYLLRRGRPDLALAAAEKARRLNPYRWSSWDSLGLALGALRRFPEALDAFQHAESLVAAPVVKANAARTLADLGRHAAAVDKAREALDPAGKRGWHEGFASWSDGLAAWALAKAGAHDEAARVVQGLLAGPEPRRFAAGFAFAAMGEQERALALLADLHQFGVFVLCILLRETNEMNGDPRCRELLQRLGAAEAYETYLRVVREQVTKP